MQRLSDNDFYKLNITPKLKCFLLLIMSVCFLSVCRVDAAEQSLSSSTFTYRYSGSNTVSIPAGAQYVNCSYTINTEYNTCTNCGSRGNGTCPNPTLKIYLLNSSGTSVWSASYSSNFSNKKIDLTAYPTAVSIRFSCSPTKNYDGYYYECCEGHGSGTFRYGTASYTAYGYKTPSVTKDLSSPMAIIYGNNNLTITTADTVSYQWQISSDNSTWDNLSDD